MGPSGPRNDCTTDAPPAPHGGRGWGTAQALLLRSYEGAGTAGSRQSVARGAVRLPYLRVRRGSVPPVEREERWECNGRNRHGS